MRPGWHVRVTRNMHARIAQERTPTGAFWIVDLEGRCFRRRQAYGGQVQRLRPTGRKGSTAVRQQSRRSCKQLPSKLQAPKAAC